MSARVALSPRGIEPVLRFDAEPVGDPVDVVEVGADLGRVVDGTVVPSRGPQRGDVALSHVSRCQRELLCVLEQGHRLRIEAGRSPSRRDPVGERPGVVVVEVEVGADLRPEIVQVGLDSVLALVGDGGDDGDELALGAAQR